MTLHDDASVEQALRLARGHQQAGRRAEAESIYRQILAARAAHVPSLVQLGQITFQAGDLGTAVPLLSRALEINPAHALAHFTLGNCFFQQRRWAEALGSYRRAVDIRPDFFPAHEMMGSVSVATRKWSAAIESYERVIALDPNSFSAYNNCAIALKRLGEIDRSIALARQALRLRPTSAEARHNLASALLEDGSFDEALHHYRQTMALEPAVASHHSTLIFALHFDPSSTPARLELEHRAWNARHVEALRPTWQLHGNDRGPERRLKVGYVSPDLREHPVSYFLLPLLEAHDPARFEVHCFATVDAEDEVTERYRACAGLVWHDVESLSHLELAGRIREQEIDILVDLSMHTALNRQPTFARRPAPVQVAWLAYAGTSGAVSVDYRFTDARMEPPELDSHWSAEERVRLPDSWCCYDPPERDIEVGPLPALGSQAGVTFGSLNHFLKINDGVLRCWAKILRAIPDSRLRLVCARGERREQVVKFLGGEGIAPERVGYIGRTSRADYLRAYHQIDIGLDPFPFNGMTTTCDALWMGVPVLSLYGEMPVSRASLSLLTAVDLPEFAVATEDELVQVAVGLAADLPGLATLRAALRPRMLASPLMDAPRFARNVEAAYRAMWRRWCVGRSAPV